MNEEVLISYERIRFGKQSRFNPIRTLTPESLSFKLDLFEYGYVREAAQLWDIIERRDYTLMSVMPKRRSAVARRSYKIMTKDSSPEAAAHKETLEYFYSNLTATNAVDRNTTGGFPQLVRQMMDCVGKKYAVHHIVWKPSPKGLTAQLYFVPLWYFENTTGALRFLLNDFDVQGQPMAPATWMVACGLGIMEVCSVCKMFKDLPLKDWLIYSQRFGVPGVQGKTQAAPGSEAWNVMLEAVQSIGEGFSCVTGLNDLIEKLEFGAQGENPFEKIIELMDRAMSTLARGGDLSTSSARTGKGQGASLQGDEAELILADDIAMIEETLQEQLEKWVIFYQHGTTQPLAYIEIDKPEQKDAKVDSVIDTLLFTTNFPMTLGDVAERYNRSLPEGIDPDTLLVVTQPQPLKPGAQQAMNARRVKLLPDFEALLDKVGNKIDLANTTAWKPIIERLEELYACNDAQFAPLGKKLLADIPNLLGPTGEDDAAVQEWEIGLGTLLANGITDPAAKEVA